MSENETLTPAAPGGDEPLLHGPLVQRVWLGEYDRVTADNRLIHPGDLISVSKEQAADHPQLFGPIPKPEPAPPKAKATPKAEPKAAAKPSPKPVAKPTPTPEPEPEPEPEPMPSPFDWPVTDKA